MVKKERGPTKKATSARQNGVERVSEQLRQYSTGQIIKKKARRLMLVMVSWVGVPH